jgi:hypothetical protein
MQMFDKINDREEKRHKISIRFAITSHIMHFSISFRKHEGKNIYCWDFPRHFL